MKTYNCTYTTLETLKAFISHNKINNHSNVLLQIFTGICEKKFIEHLLYSLNILLPQINIIGATTDGEIINGSALSHNSTLIYTL